MRVSNLVPKLAFPMASPQVADWVKAGALLALAWLVLYLPSYFDFAQIAWARDENAHAPFLLAFCFGAGLVRLRNLDRLGALSLMKPPSGGLVTGAVVLVAGLACFVLGRLGQVEPFISLSQLPVATGIVLLTGGRHLLRQLWFPLAMLAYLIIWPGWALNELTSPLKHWVSATVSDILYATGLPIARSGVLLVVGQYELLIADACSGLNSLLALTATGAIYLYLNRPRSRLHAVLVFASAIPIAIFANVVRVSVLVLLTYYGGYNIGQGFAHEFAGLFLYSVALGSLFVVDGLLSKFGKPRS